jgi:hypothetical protein
MDSCRVAVFVSTEQRRCGKPDVLIVMTLIAIVRGLAACAARK